VSGEPSNLSSAATRLNARGPGRASTASAASAAEQQDVHPAAASVRLRDGFELALQDDDLTKFFFQMGLENVGQTDLAPGHVPVLTEQPEFLAITG
jgi:hypothetical protein